MLQNYPASKKYKLFSQYLFQCVSHQKGTAFQTEAVYMPMYAYVCLCMPKYAYSLR